MIIGSQRAHNNDPGPCGLRYIAIRTIRARNYEGTPINSAEWNVLLKLDEDYGLHSRVRVGTEVACSPKNASSISSGTPTVQPCQPLLLVFLPPLPHDDRTHCSSACTV